MRKDDYSIKSKVNILTQISRRRGQPITEETIRKKLKMAHMTYVNRKDGDRRLSEIEKLAKLFEVPVIFFFDGGNSDLDVLRKYIK